VGDVSPDVKDVWCSNPGVSVFNLKTCLVGIMDRTHLARIYAGLPGNLGAEFSCQELVKGRIILPTFNVNYVYTFTLEDEGKTLFKLDIAFQHSLLAHYRTNIGDIPISVIQTLEKMTYKMSHRPIRFLGSTINDGFYIVVNDNDDELYWFVTWQSSTN